MMYYIRHAFYILILSSLSALASVPIQQVSSWELAETRISANPGKVGLIVDLDHTLMDGNTANATPTLDKELFDFLKAKSAFLIGATKRSATWADDTHKHMTKHELSFSSMDLNLELSGSLFTNGCLFTSEKEKSSPLLAILPHLKSKYSTFEQLIYIDDDITNLEEFQQMVTHSSLSLDITLLHYTGASKGRTRAKLGPFSIDPNNPYKASIPMGSNLPDKYKPKSYVLYSADILMPPPFYDLSDYKTDDRYPDYTVQKAWHNIAQSNKDYLIVHAIGISSLRRMLRYCATINDRHPDHLTVRELLQLSPFITTQLRSIVSSTLIKLNEYTTTARPLGFIFRVPYQCIIAAKSHDAMIAMENEKGANIPTQKHFRSKFLVTRPSEKSIEPTEEQRKEYENYLLDHRRKSIFAFPKTIEEFFNLGRISVMEHNLHASPQKLIEDSYAGSINEVYFSNGVTVSKSSDKEVTRVPEIIGIFINSKALSSGPESFLRSLHIDDAPQDEVAKANPKVYLDVMREIAEDFKLPVIDLAAYAKKD